ncbi:ABC transporter permease subunit [Deinococcus yavapaiensis]|uniref:ABC-2 family transporter n=1 Tax=Deinococcus yavapaiensis KR-236 TaxID=694435 RepID=A0A318S475_9DEIO|nr:ABC transporter permease subunit [Deinococcus yavapaiensis]PYE51169.1 ABC-2 family transporter [Deinococcus yavapaiensis KR-236]
MSAPPFDWRAVRAIVRKDLSAVLRSKPVMLPLVLLPALLFVVIPLAVVLLSPLVTTPAQANLGDLQAFLDRLPSVLRSDLLSRPPSQQILLIATSYLLSPLMLLVPVMVANVIAADSFAGEKERHTLEALLHSPVSDRDLFTAKVLAAWLPALGVTLLGFVLSTIVVNVGGWPVMKSVFYPNGTTLLVALWVAPGVAALGLGATVLVSARVSTFQEAFQTSGLVVLPIVLLLVGQFAGIVALSPVVAAVFGAVVWALGLLLLTRGRKTFRREELLSRG